MKLPLFSLILLLPALAVPTLADATDAPRIYINQNLGFNVEGYKYEQSKLPCDIDTVLVDKIVERGPKEGVQIEAVGTADKILNAEVPVLAIDIEALVLGSDEYTFGTNSHSNLPSVRVTAALLDKNLPDGFTSAKHSCAIATLKQLTNRSDVLDQGTVETVCSATHKCLNDLSKDIVEWVVPQVR